MTEGVVNCGGVGVQVRFCGRGMEVLQSPLQVTCESRARQSEVVKKDQLH